MKTVSRAKAFHYMENQRFLARHQLRTMEQYAVAVAELNEQLKSLEG